MNWRSSGGSVVLLALMVCAEACMQQTTSRGQPQKIDFGRRECPHTYSDKIASTIGGEVAGIDVPEFNDCQRFVMRYDRRTGTGVYGEYFAIFAGIMASQLEDSLGSYEETLPPGRNVALTAAVVLAEGRYEPLGIETGYNCLILWRDPPGSEHWMAKMISRHTTGRNDCNGVVDPNAVQGRRLRVVRRVAVHPRTGSLAGSQDYSGAARWGWDDSLKVQIAGISCSRAWCDVGPENFTPPRTYHERAIDEGGVDPTTVTREWQRVTDIKGWHDEQYLAALPQGSQAVPSSILGTVIPDPLLGTRTLQSFTDWQEVATVALQGSAEDIAGYTARFGFTQSNYQRLNRIFACEGQSCVQNVTFRDDCTCPDTENFCNDSTWYAKVVSADGSRTVYHRLCRYTMCGATIPATARWRWLSGDEGTWFRCVDGCCELIGEE